MNSEKCQVIDSEQVKLIAGRSGGKNAGEKNEGILRDVVENKCRKNVRIEPLHDVIESK